MALYAASLAGALAVGALVVAVTGHSPARVVSSLYQGSLGNWGAVGYTIDQATPLVIVALGTAVTMRAGHFNIGQEGQLTVGALTAALVALKAGGPGPLVLAAALVAAAAGGALWAMVPAVLRFWRGVDVVISSLLLVFVAGQLLEYAVGARWLLRDQGPTTAAQSGLVPASRRLPRVGRYPHLTFSGGVVLALLLAGVLTVALARSRWGFRLRMLGLNPAMAQRAGVAAALVGGGAVVLSGAFAGLAGGVMLSGQLYRVAPGFSGNVGWNGLLVALIARNHPVGCVVVAVFFGVIVAGGGFLATGNVPTDLVNVVEALLVLAAVFPPALLGLRRARRGRARAEQEEDLEVA